MVARHEDPMTRTRISSSGVNFAGESPELVLLNSLRPGPTTDEDKYPMNVVFAAQDHTGLTALQRSSLRRASSLFSIQSSCDLRIVGRLLV